MAPCGMATLLDIPGLLDADDPLAWAAENLDHVGAGGTAVVYAHPGDLGLVIRISDYPDGWFGYAMALADIAADGGDGHLARAMARHAPVALDMAYVERADGAFYVGLCERLTPAAEDCPQVATARAVMATPFEPCLEPDEEGSYEAHAMEWADAAVSDGRTSDGEVRELLGTQPLLLVLDQALPDRFSDLRESNWMMRGRHLVLNDPSRAMSHADEARFREAYAVTGSVPVPVSR